MSALHRLYRRSCWLVVTAALAEAAGSIEAIKRAEDYLAREVPRWRTENGCYSCHNNGDGARALLLAGRGRDIADTLAFLRKPSEWGEEKPLARLQFASTLAAAGESLEEAAALVAEGQLGDGHWKVDEETAPGSPVTYGPFLGTWLARQLLHQTGAAAYKSAVARADQWLQSAKPRYPVDLAAIVWALGRQGDIAALLKLQAPSGSWNGEAFDTAVAVLALSGRQDSASREAVRRGREYLLATQLEPGGWPPTTRPPGGDSYAQHISTSAWALIALIASAN
jgi:hypothetical protein